MSLYSSRVHTCVYFEHDLVHSSDHVQWILQCGNKSGPQVHTGYQPANPFRVYRVLRLYRYQ